MDRITLQNISSEYGIDDEDKQEKILEFVQANDISGLIKSKIFKEKTAKKFWAEIEGHRVYLSTRYPVKRGREKELTGVVMGGCGNGKTSLLNNICLSKLPIGESMHSKTRNITWERVQFLKSGKFIIYDTPGTTSDQETSLHATLLRTTLTYKPINVVFLQVKYERRGIDFIKDMYVQSQVIQKYADNIVYLVSHFDIAQEPDRIMKEAFEEMTRRNMNQQVVFYSNQKCDRANLAEVLYEIASNYPKVQIDISEDQFLKKFRIGNLDRFFEKDYQDKLREMQEMTDSYIECAVYLPEDPEKQYIIQELALDLKYSLMELLEEFQEKAKDLILKHDYYGVYYALQKIIIESDEKFQARTKHFYSYNMFHRHVTGNSLDIRDLIKQCPCCKEIWFRVESCPNTTCGQRPSSFWDFFIGRSFFYYDIKKVGKRVRVTKRGAKSQASETGIKIKEKRLEEQVKHSELARGDARLSDKKVGCGYQINFDQLPRIPDIEERLKEWYNVTDIREIDIKLKSNKQVMKQRQKNEQIANEDMRKCEQRLETEEMEVKENFEVQKLTEEGKDC